LAASETSSDSPPAGEAAPEEAERPAVHRPAWLADMPFWTLSAAFHFLLLQLLLWLAPAGGKPEREARQVTVSFPLPRAERSSPPAERPLPLPRPAVAAPGAPEPQETFEAEVPRGSEVESLSSAALAGLRLEDALGLAGGLAAAYGERLAKTKLLGEGGSAASEDAVRAALEWLRRHQSPDGGWRAAGFTERCSPLCQNRDPKAHGDGRGGADYDTGVTALALLAFTGSGHSHRDGPYPEYVECARKAVAYLKRAQVRSHDLRIRGRYGGGHRKWIYDHAIATLAMAEALLLSSDVIGLKASVRNAVELCLAAQNPGRGWRYGFQPGDSDVSASGWMVLALKTAKGLRLGIPEESFERAFEGALSYFRAATDASGRTGYRRGGEGDNSARGWGSPHPFSKELSCMTAVSLLSRLFAGESRSEPAIRKAAQILLRQLPSWQEPGRGKLSSINFYHWYYATYALFQLGGAEWRAWNRAMLDALLGSQRRGGCEDGSWDPIGEWAIEGGRVYATALGAMTLEVYYRFQRMEE
jgi:hypothetical protein